jgi:hypothetical protein
MAQKIQIIIEDYDAEEKIVEGKKVDLENKATRFREKGITVDEFKKLIRKKFGDKVDIVNRVQKHRDVLYGERNTTGPDDSKGKADGVSTRDIIEIMKNKYSD